MPGVTALLLVLLGQAATSVPPASNADFPRYDRAAWDLQRAGLMAKAAERSLRRAPDAVETLELLLAARRTGEALGVLRRIVDRHPERMARGFEVVWRGSTADFHDDGLDHQIVLQRIVEAGFARLKALPREEAARAERQLMMIDTREPGMSFREQLSSFVEKKKGTEAAAVAEIEALMLRGGKDKLDALDDFVRAHTGELLAARALHRKGQYLSSNSEVGVRDPTDRLLAVAGIVKELQSGRYPASEWVDRAPRLITGFSWYQPRFSPSNLRLVTDIFFEALKRHAGTFAPYDYAGPEDLVIRRFPELFELYGEGVAGVEQLIDRLERETGDHAAADYLRVVLSLSRLNSRGYFYRGNRIDVTEAERQARTETTTRLLDGLVRGENRYTRWALATLATFHFEQLDFSRARVRYREYLDRFGASEYAWVAALRLGECAEGAGDRPAAAEAYRAAATRRGVNPVAAVMGRVAAAFVFESEGRLDLALAEYRQAQRSWDTDYGREYALIPHPSMVRNRADALDRQVGITKLRLNERVEKLAAAVSSPPLAILERGHWLLEQRRWTDARAEFERLVATHPREPQVSSARYGAQIARLQQALDHLKDGSLQAALTELETGREEPYDHAVMLSNIARASMMRLRGDLVAAEGVMNQALSRARAEPQARPGDLPRTALERDVLAIRTLVFQPREARPYLLVNSDVSVTLADGEQLVVASRHPLSGRDQVLFLTGGEVALLNSIAASFRKADLAGRDEPMYSTLAWWNTFFEARTGHWVPATVETHPFIWRLEFTDARRTRATARVRTSYSTGHAIVLQKVNEVWQVIRTGRSWME